MASCCIGEKIILTSAAGILPDTKLERIADFSQQESFCPFRQDAIHAYREKPLSLNKGQNQGKLFR